MCIRDRPGSDPAAVAAELGITVDRGEFERFVRDLAQHQVVELSDDELNQVTGGIEPATLMIVGTVASIFLAGGLGITAGVFSRMVVEGINSFLE